MSHPIRRLNDLAECCVFVKQSVDPFHCDPAHSIRSIAHVAKASGDAPIAACIQNELNVLGTPSSEVTGLDCRVP